MRIPAFGRRPGRLAALTTAPAVALLLAACGEQENTNPTGDDAFPSLFTGEVVTRQGSEAAGLYLPVFIVAVAIFVLVEGLLLYMTWRYRRRDKTDELPHQTHGNNRLEVIWTAIPALVVMVMFVFSTMVLTNVEAKSDEPSVVVDVTAFRFGWQFDYPDSGISIAGGGREAAPEMVLPIDEPVLFRLTAADVIHSFYVPSFFYKRDAVPGRVNEFEVTIEKPGVYGGQCAEFCGLAHSDMFFSVRAVEADEYRAWVEEQTTPPGSPPPGSPPPGSPPPGSPPPEGSAAPGSPPAESPPPEGGVVLEIASVSAEPLAYTESTLEARTGQTVTVRYTNDTNVPHNIAFFDSLDSSGSKIGATDIITGPGAVAEVTFQAPDSPGSYFFRCDVHPIQMTGTLEVSP